MDLNKNGPVNHKNSNIRRCVANRESKVPESSVYRRLVYVKYVIVLTQVGRVPSQVLFCHLTMAQNYKSVFPGISFNKYSKPSPIAYHVALVQP